jgi:Uma2 family endonuclease
MISKLPTFIPLENGDRLTRHEFERRYAAMPHLKKAELIEGIVYMPAALRFRSHGKPHALLIAWLSDYWLATSGVELGIEPTVRLDDHNEPQPDAVLLIDPIAGGQTRISQDDYIEGAPELIVEIAASSAAIDLHAKKQSYCRNGVQEYIVWQVLDQRLDWFFLNAGEYCEFPIEANGTICSQVFPGLWLSVNDLLSGQMQQVLNILQTGLQSTEHEAFVQQLAGRINQRKEG